VNNTFWDGTRSPNVAIDFPTDGISELPVQGSTELWEIVNLTTDAHPMHTHLVQFQILNREDYNPGYVASWGNAFISTSDPTKYVCGATVGDPLVDPANPCPGYGPPLPYMTADATIDTADPILNQLQMKAIGGNLPLGPYLSGTPTAPGQEEAGWKDTAKAMPRAVLRLVIRWTPTDTPVKSNGTYAGQNLFPFDPTEGDGYVWHCHIIDHEDNEMMRPYKVKASN
jgi:FtsP/CotA-like multicopper oxidase with cupredoxin domain